MRALQIERLVKSEIEELPKGSIQKRKSKEKSIPICNTAAETL